MDWNKLQHTLFELDPTDPREDLAKLKAQATGATAAPAQETVDYLNESAKVREGSLQIDRDYSISDFAALAGVVTEGKQKTGSAGQAKGKNPMPKAEPGRTKHPLQDKLVGEETDRIAALEARVAQLEQMLEAQKQPTLKPRDPSAQYMNDLRKSGAMGAHKDKKKDAKAGKVKHKSQQYESLKEQLMAMLKDK
jgi:hypothetical protein